MDRAAQEMHLPPTCKLSVMLKAYNHEPFIAHAIESAIAQRTSFPIEIIIGDDCSTDRTLEIIRTYQARHPTLIRVLAHPSNLGMTGNTMALYAECRGEYVAWLDGDDYWLSPDKLQRQVDFLDANPDHALCFHDSLVVKPEGATRHSRDPHWSGSVEDMLFRGCGTSSSCVYRKVLNGFPAWFATLPYSDWALQVLHAEKGKAGWLPEMHVVYRPTGASVKPLGAGDEPSRREVSARWQAEVLGALNRHFNFRYADGIALELLKTGAASFSIRAATGPSRLRTRVWQAVRTRPRLARLALASAAALARLVLRAQATWRRLTGAAPH
ncbi:MAG: glycosyl transferase family 2 [Bradyrhizobium sp.]|nr:glycosyl transferase family 2 [Bradyrhizobium sp.]